MKEGDTLTDKERHLVFLGASIGSGCRPCTKYHITKSLEVGFTANEINCFLVQAISIRDIATRNLESFAMNNHSEDESDIDIPENLNRNDIILGTAASYSVNFQPGFSKFKDITKKNGISDEELGEILKLSAAVSEKARSLLV